MQLNVQIEFWWMFKSNFFKCIKRMASNPFRFYKVARDNFFVTCCIPSHCYCCNFGKMEIPFGFTNMLRKRRWIRLTWIKIIALLETERLDLIDIFVTSSNLWWGIKQLFAKRVLIQSLIQTEKFPFYKYVNVID